MPKRLSESFYQRDAITVARALLGQLLVRQLNGRRTTGIIVETEAYLGTIDQAAHTANAGKRPPVISATASSRFSLAELTVCVAPKRLENSSR